ncbi:hypothetical protein FVR03_05725 [Pontibacter qinzhouensis]|uniref:TIGR02588 family protein n=1 Tax=Pontibacter qinzhouensis TaxID=2603253 RepID=A0A5C8KDT6_9BACT|nr:hypothetical protein [Pontibacter qinzhouensis]TXK49820.1 hypothetical protein FVR03_05725 [Pontibacter qinzhouensis]
MQRNIREGDDDKNVLEWLVFGCSLLLICAVFMYLGYQAYTAEKDPKPELEVHYRLDPSALEPYRYHIKVENRGKETAEEVTIQVWTEKDGQELESADLQLPFAPKESSREGWIIFKDNPALADTIVARVKSYKKP